MVDYHMHSYLCRHGDGEIYQYVESAIDKGLTEIGFSEHIPIPDLDDPTGRMVFDDWDVYVQDVMDAQKRYSEIKIRFGIEADYLPAHMAFIENFVSQYPFDFVIGSRILGDREKDSLFRISGVYFFGFVISLLLGKKVTDPSSGFRAFKMDAMASIRLYEDQYHTSELIIEAVKKGVRIGEVPITILRRKYGKSKKGKDWVYGFHFARIIFKTWWR